VAIKCVICGEESRREIELPHGNSIHLCYGEKCENLLILKVVGHYPVLWVGPDDYLEDDEDLIKEYSGMTEEESFTAGRIASRHFQQDEVVFGILRASAKYALKEVEANRIAIADKKELPLLIHKIHFEENKEIYKARLEDGN